MDPLSPKGMVYLTSSSDEEEDSLVNEEEEKQLSYFSWIRCGVTHPLMI
jgi:hypothetical protein